MFGVENSLVYTDFCKNLFNLGYMITIIDYGDECTKSVADALKKITNDLVVSRFESDICNADKLIFPGSGSAADAIKKIHLLNLFSVLRIIKKPILGIGLGMQLMADYTTEGNVACLGLLPGKALEFSDDEKALHKGMHKININKQSILFNGIDTNSEFYFNNSYYLPENEFTTSVCKNKIVFCSSMENKFCYAVQFHPEKSGEAGMQILKNFVEA